MRDSTLVVASRVLVGLGILLSVGGSTVVVVEAGLDLWWTGQGSFVAVLAISFGVFGALVVRRQPRNPVVWTLTGSSLLSGMWPAGIAWAILAGGGPAVVLDSQPIPAQLPSASVWILAAANVAVVVAIFLHLTFGVLLFPDGRLPSRGWRWVGALGGFSMAGTAITFAYEYRPTNTVMVGIGLWFNFFFSLLLLSALASLVGLAVRYRRSSGTVQQQIKWVFWGASIFVPVVVAVAGFVDGSDYDALTPVLLMGAGIVYFAAYGLAVGRHGLFDVDVIISKTAVLAGLAGFITAVYAVVVGAVGVLLGSGADAAVPLSVAATVIVAIAFQPLRGRLTALANRLVYGKRDSPYEVLSQLSKRMRDQVATEDVMPRIAQLVGVGTGAQSVTVWSFEGETARVGATWPPDGDHPETTVSGGETLPHADHRSPIEHDGSVLGVIGVTMPRGEAMTDTVRRLVDDVAAQAGLVLRNALLVDQLRSSRKRLVAAQDDERRRLERDLHDGAQQQFVAAKMKLSAARTLVDDGAIDRMRPLLDDVLAAIDDGVDSLRNLAHGIYPPLLEAEGLGPALRAHAIRSGIPLTVETDGLGRYPSGVEAAVYFCVLEAIQNSNKYSAASEIRVTVSQEDGSLVFEVADDGHGFDPTVISMGRGITNIKDRLDALGGSASIRSAPGEGATIVGRVPVGTT